MRFFILTLLILMLEGCSPQNNPTWIPMAEASYQAPTKTVTLSGQLPL